ncbi:MAG TPA: DNA repair protein RadC [Thermoanaerobaculia bacterium]|nr:DNA repair protein RadC [Thermoanaerobaculia bacterium]
MIADDLCLIRELPTKERPRERLLAEGTRALSDRELLAVLLRTGIAGLSALRLATDLLVERGGLVGLLDTCPKDLERRGLGPAKAATLLAAVEIGRRLAYSRLADRIPLEHPAAVVRYVSLRYGGRHQEVVGALYLDARQRLLAERELFRGTLDRSLVEPREVLKEGLLRGAASLILFHTHPSGDPSPSSEDLLFTRRLAEACEVVGIALVDHLIVAHGGRWTSLKREGAW